MIPGTAEAVAGLVVLVVVGLLTSAIRPDGRLRAAIAAAVRKRRTAAEAHGAIPEAVEKLEDIQESQADIKAEQTRMHGKVDEIDRELGHVDTKVEETQRTIALLHQNDLTQDQHEELRERLEVDDLDADLVGD